jgi:ATP-dependent helicase YprA (DUF1998 family)
VVICTSTASGKSLCYNVPILEALVEDSHATALYMFPTKALAQDQLRALRELCTATFGARAPAVDVYDGDTAMVRVPAALFSLLLFLSSRALPGPDACSQIPAPAP